MGLEDAIERHREVLREIAGDGDGGALGPFASVSDTANFVWVGGRPRPTVERFELHSRLIGQVLDGCPDALSERRAVVMAGPPGAGKGFVQETVLGGLAGFVPVDPDRFKELLLTHEMAAGGLDRMTTPLMREYMARGEKFAPMEYSTLIHQESSYVAQRMRNELMETGTNLVIDTVLRDRAGAEAVASSLSRHGYTFEVVDVETTAELSRASRHGRWRDPYELYLQGEHELGGRPVPSDFAQDLFPAGGGPSMPEQSARWLAESSPGCLRYRVYRRASADASHVLEVDLNRMKPGGKLLSVAEIKGQRAAAFGRGQAGPLRSPGAGVTPPRGPGQNPNRPTGNSRGL